jgi:AcrR family transcriptional regulator
MYICSTDAGRCKKMVEKRKEVAEEEDAPRSSLQALRSERTRVALLAAAEKIFARDGFEASRIEDIAAEAGRSRGAFYANFLNKTEVFLALRTRAMQRKAREMRLRLGEASDEAERIAAVNRHIIEQICDTQSLLLQIEFKLFALRHPELREELAERHIDASVSVHEKELKEFFPDNTSQSKETREKTLAIEGLLEGLALNALFSPSVLDLSYLEELAPKLLAEILSDK